MKHSNLNRAIDTHTNFYNSENSKQHIANCLNFFLSESKDAGSNRSEKTFSQL